MSKLHPIFYSLRSDAHISVNKALAHALGLNEAVLYAELLSRRFYFEQREELTADGFFFNTVEDLRSGTTLSGYYQRLALKNLIDCGLVDVRLSGIPAKRYFRIVNDAEKVQELLEIGQGNSRKCPVSHSDAKFESLESRVFNTNNNTTSENEINPELMRTLSIELWAHEQSKPTKKQILQRSHSLSAQGCKRTQT